VIFGELIEGSEFFGIDFAVLSVFESIVGG
jgi:hypothetical protein